MCLKTIYARRRTPFKPPTATEIGGAVSTRILVVVNVRRTEWHPICLPIHMIIIVESVTGVATVPGHVQCVFVVL